MALSSSVTAPFNAQALPSIDAPLPTVMLSIALNMPLMVEVSSKVAVLRISVGTNS